MTGNSEFGKLLTDFWADLQQPDVIWQIFALAVSLGLAVLADRFVRRRPYREDSAWHLGHRGLKRVTFPLVALLLVVVARVALRPWHHVNLLSVAVPLLVSLAVIRMVFFVLRHNFQGAWVGGFERGFSFLAWLVVALHITGLLPDLIDFLDGIGFSVGRQHLTLWLILQGLVTVLATLLLALWVAGAIESRLHAMPGLEPNLQVLLSRSSKALLILLAILIGLPAVGIDLTTLSVFGGALGVGIGFGLQKVAANYVSGFIILLDRSIRIGDTVAVSGERGKVTRITTRYTVLKGNTGAEAIVPNEVLIGSVVQNETLSDKRVRLSLPVQVSYAADLERAMAILVAAAQSQPRVLKDPAPAAFVVAFADSGINLEVGFWIEDPLEGVLALQSAVNLAVWREFKLAGIEIPFPQREVRLLGQVQQA
jgi:small-conductance mechanosensitive channel